MDRLDRQLIGKRVELHPVTDDWMRGDRFGEIVSVGRKFYYIKLDKSGRTRKTHPSNVLL